MNNVDNLFCKISYRFFYIKQKPLFVVSLFMGKTLGTILSWRKEMENILETRPLFLLTARDKEQVLRLKVC